MALESISHFFLNSFTEPHLKMYNTKHTLSKSNLNTKFLNYYYCISY